MYKDQVTTVYKHILDNNPDKKKRKSIGIVGVQYNIDYLQKLIDPNIDDEARYLVFDHHNNKELLTRNLKMYDIYNSSKV